MAGIKGPARDFAISGVLARAFKLSVSRISPGTSGLR